MSSFPNISAKDKQSDFPFGDLAAEKDALLIQSFVDLGYLQAIDEHQCSLFIGPKGAGKSAIVRYYTENNSYNKFVSMFDKKRLEGLFHYLHLSHKTPALLDAITEILLLITAAESIASDHSLFTAGSWPEIESCLKALHVQFSINRKQSERKLEVDIPKIFSRLSLMDKTENPTATLVQLQGLSNKIKIAIEKIQIDNLHTIFLDNLDEDYSRTNIHEFKNVLLSLLISANKLNEINKSIYFITFLRDDILSRLYDANLGKIANRSKPIVWGQTKEEVSSNFGNFIKNRIKATAPLAKYRAHDGWGMLFEECYGRAQEPWNNLNPESIIDKTLWRPRDILEFMNSFFINFKNLDTRNLTPEKLKQSSYSTEKKYSEYLMSEFKDSMHTEINEITDFNNLIQQCKKMKKPSFTIQDWAKLITKPLELAPADSERLLEIMFNHSLLGTHSKSHGEKWAYRGHYGEFDSTATIKFHPGLFKHFNFYYNKEANLI